MEKAAETAANGHKLIRELLGLFFVFFGLLILLSLWTFDVKDPTLNQTVSGAVPIKNAAGMFGAYLSGLLTDLFGFASYLWGVFFLTMGAGLVSTWFVLPWYRWIGYILLALCVLTASEAFAFGIRDVRGGGILGAMIYASAHKMLSPSGSFLAWFFTLLVALELSFKISWMALAGRVLRFLGRTAKEVPSSLPKPKVPALPGSGKSSGLKGKATEKDKQGPILDIVIDKPAKPARQEPPKSESMFGRLRDKGSAKGARKSKGGKDSKDAQDDSRLPLPSIDLLSPPAPPKPGEDNGPDATALEAKGNSLITGLQNFGVEAKLARITPGPVVTMFEVRPEPGVRVNRIASLSHDLAMSLKASSVRIQAPIPGTDTVGVEVPNARRLDVNFREIIESDAFSNSSSLLSLALGKDIGGNPVTEDLAKMPHLLVAGATGAGKSVALNSIILSLLYKARPDEVQMLLVDPKKVELAMYADLPHLIHPVVTEMDLAKTALDWAVDEMNRRYDMFKQAGVRNITGFNEKVAKQPDNLPEEDLLERMPFMVLIVDELADLMMTKGKEVEGAIVRLAQLARAAGIHLIIATQRPSVDVVTGLIKANFPCRMAFQVTSGHDSRTILDTVGAETLLGKGDMLFKPSGGKLRRLHGAFASDEDVVEVVAHWKKQCKPNYKIDFSQLIEDAQEQDSAAAGGMDDDPIYAEAVTFAKSQGNISISKIQRRFKVGYNRAARMVEQMEQDGIVGPGDSSKPRQVLW